MQAFNRASAAMSSTRGLVTCAASLRSRRIAASVASSTQHRALSSPPLPHTQLPHHTAAAALRTGAVSSQQRRALSRSVALLSEDKKTGAAAGAGAATTTTTTANGEECAKRKPKKEKKGIAMQAWDFVLHIYHGLRLLSINTRIAVKLQKRVVSGSQLTRRERQLLEKTTRDLIRMVPFSFFIIIPGAEVLLPVALVLFPDLTPSTFSTRQDVRKKEIVENLKKGVRSRRIFEHTFSRIIIEEEYDLYSSSWGILKRVGQGDVVTEKDIRYLSSHFQPGRKLDLRNIPSYILRDVAKVLGVYHWFGGRFLPRYLYDARLRTLVDEYFERQDSDDWNLLVAGIEHLTDQELEHECMKRNMRWFAPPSALRHQLKQWCAITQSEDVPSHILSFVRPCATSHVQMLKGLSEDEINSVMNNKKYEDAPMKKILSQLRSGIQKDKTSSTSIDVSILEEEIDDLKTRVESAKDEAAAAEEALRFVQKEFADFEEAQILGFFDAINKVHGVLRKDEERAVNVVVLSRKLLDSCKKINPNLGLSTYRLIMALREFDIDASDLICKSEFESFLVRIRDD